MRAKIDLTYEQIFDLAKSIYRNSTCVSFLDTTLVKDDELTDDQIKSMMLPHNINSKQRDRQFVLNISTYKGRLMNLWVHAWRGKYMTSCQWIGYDRAQYRKALTEAGIPIPVRLYNGLYTSHTPQTATRR